MCRLFGLHGGATPVPATFWLIDAPDSLAEQSHANPDGAGIGDFGPGGELAVTKQPLAAWADPAFATGAHDLIGTTFVAHVRYASTGAHTEVNTHPFAQDGRLFAHNGVVQGLPELDARLAELGVADLVQGQTDSERVFALVTAEIRARGGDVTAGLVAGMEWVSAHLPLYAVNLVLATADGLWALRYPATHELWILERPAGGSQAGPDAALEARSRRIHARSDHLAAHPAVIVASERMDDDPGWRLIGPGELMHVGAELHVTSSTPLPPAPDHLLTLADLEPEVAASQHPDRLSA